MLVVHMLNKLFMPVKFILKKTSVISETGLGKKDQINPVTLTIVGYLFYIVCGLAILSLPFMQSRYINMIDNLFITTSAVSGAGLVTVSIAGSYSFFGQLVILILIQLGNIGFMTWSSFIILTRRKDLPTEVASVNKTVFSVPETFKIETFIKAVIFFTFLIELCGSILLYFVFLKEGVPNPVWHAVFHSVSAFCTAGLSTFNNNFMNYRSHLWVNATISLLSLLGALGFIVFIDLWLKLTGKIKKITFTSQIILKTTVFLVTIGTLLMYFTEPSLHNYPWKEKLLICFFQVISAHSTAGFNTVGMATFSRATLLLLTMMMIIGASPSGTGGGIRTTSFTAILGLMRSVSRGETEIRFLGREIPRERVLTAAASGALYFMFFCLGIYLLSLTSSFDIIDIIFECASALSTVGLSTGITSSLNNAGKLIVISLMIIGRAGLITFGAAMFLKPNVNLFNIKKIKKEDLAV
ncbi:MAG: potassium transporter TrkG [Candidatus Margulisbacteria bacterium]|nr:potassium transporter TrkG [Candidatus Margulisiibacteriota bacterium]